MFNYDLGRIRCVWFSAIVFICVKNFLFGEPEEDETMDNIQKYIIFRLFGCVMLWGIISFLMGIFSIRTSAVQLLAGSLGWSITNIAWSHLANRS